MFRKCMAEWVGTFALVFVGTGAIMAGESGFEWVSRGSIALAFGGVVAAMVMAVGRISGAHLNPAVTIGLWRAHRFQAAWVVPYVISQVCGAVTASHFLWWLVDGRGSLGATIPAIGEGGAFALEVALTFLLTSVILRVTSGNRTGLLIPAIAIGGTIGLAALFAGPLTGASMNPARSLAPALAAGNLYGIWIYLTAPILGSVLAVTACRSARPSGCCVPAEAGESA